MTTVGKCPAHNTFNFGDVTFSSNFDNGNLAKVEQVPNKSFEFRIWTAPDNMGSSYQSKHCAWYYFMVTGLPQGCVLRIQIVNTSNHSGLYKFDMRPVYRSNSTNQKWARLKNSVRFSKDGNSQQLYFEHGVDIADDKLYFAFTYPYTYTMMQQELEDIDKSHINDPSNKNSLYYMRELITNSLDGRRIDLLTITSSDGASITEYEPLLPGLFPDTKKITERPVVFPHKEVVFISARVHPGEVPAQHTFKGILNLLMDSQDLRARELRARYVFKLIPMLNPDGVYRGHFRMDQLGQNLNRYYINSDAMHQPSIFAARSLTDYYASIGTLAVYLDFHAHASKRGCFIYGNVLDSAEDQIQNQLYCKLIAMNSAHFDYEGCLFSRDHMTRIDPGDQAKGLTAEGSGRVSMYLAHKIIHSYTIECNYNTSRVGNEISPPDTDPCGTAINPVSSFTTNPEKYTPNTFAGVGRACVIALLDIRGHNPCSRISKSKFKTLDRVRNAVMMEVRSRKEYIGKSISRERRRSITSLERKAHITGTNGEPVAGSLSSVDDLCWRRLVESAVDTATAPTAGSSQPTGSNIGSNLTPGQSASLKAAITGVNMQLERSNDVFFVSMKDGKGPRRRMKSASVSISTTSTTGTGPAPLPPSNNNGTTTPRARISTATKVETSNTGTVIRANPPQAPRPVKSSLPAVPNSHIPTRPSVRIEGNSNYIASNAFTPHVGRKTSIPSSSSSSSSLLVNDLVGRDASTGRLLQSSFEVSHQPDSRSASPIVLLPTSGSTPGAIVDVTPKDLGLQTTSLHMPTAKRTLGPSPPVGDSSGTSGASSSIHNSNHASHSSGVKVGRNILGKKLHAAGVALVMGNGPVSCSSLEGTDTGVLSYDYNAVSDTMNRLCITAGNHSGAENTSGSSDGSGTVQHQQQPPVPMNSTGPISSSTAPRLSGIATTDAEDFSYIVSPSPSKLSISTGASNIHLDGSGSQSNPVKSIRSPQQKQPAEEWFR